MSAVVMAESRCIACATPGAGGYLTVCVWEPESFFLRLCWDCAERLTKAEREQARRQAWGRYTAAHPRPHAGHETDVVG